MSEGIGKLAAALAQAGSKIKNVPKSAKHPHFGYFYATESDIVAAVRGELFAAGVAIVPAVTSYTREPVEIVSSTRTRSTFHFTANMSFTLVHSESGEQMVTPWVSESLDSEDKGLSKCFTNGLKYFLRQLFLIDTGDLADEIDSGQGEGDAKSRGQATTHGAKTKKPEPLKPGQPIPGEMNVGQKQAIERLMQERRGIKPEEIGNAIASWPFITAAEAGRHIAELQKD